MGGKGFGQDKGGKPMSAPGSSVPDWFGKGDPMAGKGGKGFADGMKGGFPGKDAWGKGGLPNGGMAPTVDPSSFYPTMGGGWSGGNAYDPFAAAQAAPPQGGAAPSTSSAGFNAYDPFSAAAGGGAAYDPVQAAQGAQPPAVPPQNPSGAPYQPF